MTPSIRRAVLAALLVLAVVPAARAEDEADEGADGGAAAPPAPPPAQLYEQTDRKRTMTIKLPRSWKTLSGEEGDPSALANWGGFFGEEGKSDNGFVGFYVDHSNFRATLARSQTLPQIGTVVPDSLRAGPGWAEGCVTGDRRAIWQRFVEKGGQIYIVRIICRDAAYSSVKPIAQQLLDTVAVPGEVPVASPGDKFVAKKMGAFDAMTDAAPDRESSLKHAVEQLETARDYMVKALGPKPFDTARPTLWIYQNGQKFEDRLKAAYGQKLEFGAFSSPDRAALVTILSDNAQGHDEAIYRTGARQYLWQYFGGNVPLWLEGLPYCAVHTALGGGKKIEPQTISAAKSAAAAGKRRLDQWFDVASWGEVTDNTQGANELFAWHWYFREGKGAKKFKKQYTAYLQALRDTGDPAAARKAFDGVNFDEMLQEFKAWAADWK